MFLLARYDDSMLHMLNMRFRSTRPRQECANPWCASRRTIQKSPLFSSFIRKSWNDVWRGTMGRLPSGELTLLNNEPSRRSIVTTEPASSLSLDACPRKVVRERMESGSNAVMSCPTTERNRSRVFRCVTYPSSTSLYNSSNGSCPSRSGVSFKRWLMHSFLLNPKHSGGSRTNLQATAAH